MLNIIIVVECIKCLLDYLCHNNIVHKICDDVDVVAVDDADDDVSKKMLSILPEFA